MLETLTLDASTTTLPQSAEPEVVIDGITFEEGKLWKPRYPSLINYSLVPPGYQLEPAIQIADLEQTRMTVLLSLAEGFIFQTEPLHGGVKVRWVDGTNSLPPSSISAVLESPGACRVTWTREPSSPSTIALRFFCRPSTGPDPVDEESLVEGGVYLAFVVREEAWPEELLEYLREHPFPEPSEAPPFDGARMQVLATLLPEGHIKYHVFEGKAPAGTAFELAFRVRRHAPPLKVDVRITNPGFVYKPRLENPAEVDREVTHPAVPQDPVELATLFGQQESICEVVWTSEQPDDESGLSCSFNLVAVHAELRSSFRPVDPSIIEPPRCTNGICID